MFCKLGRQISNGSEINNGNSINANGIIVNTTNDQNRIVSDTNRFSKDMKDRIVNIDTQSEILNSNGNRFANTEKINGLNENGNINTNKNLNPTILNTNSNLNYRLRKPAKHNSHHFNNINNTNLKKINNELRIFNELEDSAFINEFLNVEPLWLTSKQQLNTQRDYTIVINEDDLYIKIIN